MMYQKVHVFEVVFEIHFFVFDPKSEYNVNVYVILSKILSIVGFLLKNIKSVVTELELFYQFSSACVPDTTFHEKQTQLTKWAWLSAGIQNVSKF